MTDNHSVVEQAYEIHILVKELENFGCAIGEIHIYLVYFKFSICEFSDYLSISTSSLSSGSSLVLSIAVRSEVRHAAIWLFLQSGACFFISHYKPSQTLIRDV